MDKNKSKNLFFFVLERLKILYTEEEYKLLHNEEIDPQQITKIYDFLKLFDILDKKLKEKDKYNKNSKIISKQIIEWASYRPHTENQLINNINIQVRDNINPINIPLKRRNIPIYENALFIESIEILEEEEDQELLIPATFQSFSLEDTLFEYKKKKWKHLLNWIQKILKD